MRSVTKKVSAITMFIEDVARSKAFYSDVFGATVLFEDEDSVAFRFEDLIVNLLVVAAAGELVEPGVVGNSGTGARFVLTINVENVDAVCGELAERGVAPLNGPIDRPWGIRTASFTDPDGYVWEVAHPLDKGQTAATSS